MTVFDGLSVVEIVYGLDRLDRADRLEACMPPQVSVPKPGPCPGSKRGAKKAADAIKDAVKKAAPKKTADKATEPKKATVKSTVAKKTAEPKAPKISRANKTADTTGSAPTAPPAGNDAYTGPSFRITPEQQKLIDERARLKHRLAAIDDPDAEDGYDLDAIFDLQDDIDKIESRLPEALFERLRNEELIERGIEYMRTNVEDDEVAMDPQEMRRRMVEQLKTEFQGKELAIRTTPLALDKILDDGRFKSQHETGKGGAVAQYLPKRRKEFEAKTWGIPVTGFPNERRPIHGYVAIHGIGPADDDYGLSQHGRVQVVLKDSVRPRTTAMIGDVLDQQTQARPSPLNALEHWSYNPAYATRGAVPERELNDKKFRAWGYADAQFHDGVAVSDIKEVVFPEQPNRQLQEKLEREGVPWRVIPSKAKNDD